LSDQSTISQEIKFLGLSTLLAAAVVFPITLIKNDLRIAASVGVGVSLSILNIYFYAMVASALLIKKNIAWIGPVIVIKYLLLIVSIYFIWHFCEVLSVLVGLFSELVLTAFFYWLVKIKFSKGKPNGTF
jgi:hypothetical protein